MVKRDGPVEEIEIEQVRLGGSTSSHASDPQLTLEILIERIWPLTPELDQNIDVDLQIRNRGDRPVSLPVSLSDASLKPENHGRTVLRFRLRLERQGSEPLAEAYAGALYGASDASGTMMTLQPGESLHVKTRASLGNSLRGIAGGRGPKNVPVSVKASVSEDFLSEGELRVEKTSVPVVSGTGISLTVLMP